MKTIRELFAKPIDRRIEEVIKVDQDDESTVLEELNEYVLTESIGEHFHTVYKAIADAPSDPHEGVGIWISGFFGSGKSSFAKIVGYTVAGRVVGGKSAGEIIKNKAAYELSKPLGEAVCAYLDVINTRLPIHAVIFDVSMDRGVRYASERLTEIMYKALLRELDYAEDFDLAELEMSLEADGLLDTFLTEFASLHGKPWRVRRKLGRAVNEASAVLHKMQPDIYNEPDSWAKSLGQGRADISPNLLAERAFELMARRKPGYALIFVIDEVGQYVSRSVDKMLDLQAVVQAFGREGKNRVTRRQATAPCWIVVTSQEKLNEVVDALDSKKIELARLQDRFPYAVDLKQSDITEITGKRVLKKNKDGERILASLYREHEGRLKNLCSLERTGRNVDLSRQAFVDLYPYLPYQIDLCIDIVSGLRLRRGAHRHIGGSNRTIIKQAQQMLVHPRTKLADAPVGELVTLDRVYEVLYAGDLLPTEVTREVDDVPRRLPGDETAHKVVKAVALLEVVTDLPRTPQNLAAVLMSRVDAEPNLKDVKAALHRLVEAQIVRESEEGYKLLTIQEKNWDTTRRGLDPKPAERNRITKELLKEIFSDPAIRGYRYQNRMAFPLSVAVDGEVVEASGQIPLEILTAEGPEDMEPTCDEARRASNEKSDRLFWVFALTEELHRLIEELYRSREMIASHERLAAQGKLSPEEAACLADEKVRRDRTQRTLRKKLTEAVASGAGFFRGVRRDGSSLGERPEAVFAAFRDQVIPDLYPKFELGNRPVKGDEVEKFLTAANLTGLPSVFYDPPEGLGLVIRESGKAVPNLDAPICREVLEYLSREHDYGNKVTGKILEDHFGGIGYAWDRDVLRLVLAVLLRGGAIEVTHQGRKYRNHTDPACRQPFVKHIAFRNASFAPRKALDLKTLADAARRYEAVTGEEADVEESALAQAFKKLAAEDREILVPVLEKMKAFGLPGVEVLEEFKQTVEGVLEMPTDDCVKTLAGEGKSYQETRKRLHRLSEVLDEKTLGMLRTARRVLGSKYPVLRDRSPSEEIDRAGEVLKDALERETFYESLVDIRQASDQLAEAYRHLYSEFHRRCFEAYSAALERIKGLAEWKAVSENPDFDPAQRKAILAPLESKMCETLELAPDAEACALCKATLAQLESDMAALPSLESAAVDRLRDAVLPEKKTVRVRVAHIVDPVVESEEDLARVIEELKAYLEKSLAEDVRIILE